MQPPPSVTEHVPRKNGTSNGIFPAEFQKELYRANSPMSYRANERKSDENISNFSVTVVPAEWLGHLKGLWWNTRDIHLPERLT